MTSEVIEITPVNRPVIGEIEPPGSKSITNRALICAALADGRSRLTGALDSEDTRVMLAALQSLGVKIESSAEQTTLIVDGTSGNWQPQSSQLHLANSGTSIRFLTALSCLIPGEVRLDGIARMRARPIGDLVDALRQLGASIEYELQTGFPPLVVKGNGELRGGVVGISGAVSSQFLSALMMAAPYAGGDVSVAIRDELVSKPYVEITRRVMQAFGVDAKLSDDLSEIKVATERQYQSCDYAIEPDASAASYFWAAAAITGGAVKVRGLNNQAMQGDVAFCRCLEQMGCVIEESASGMLVRGGRLRGIDIDMNAISDTVQTLSAVALFAEGPTRIRGVAHNRHKETDRIGDLATELRKLGARVEEFEDGLAITPGQIQAAEIETYNDHRMAMSLSLVGLRQSGVRILNPSCTEKTYPHFFADLSRLVDAASTEE